MSLVYNFSDFQLCLRDRMSDLTADELDDHVRTLTAGNRLVGPNMVKAK